MSLKRELAQSAYAAALRLRRHVGVAPSEPVCVFDVADSLGIEVRFVDIPSMEGAYIHQASPVILVSARRPSGRKAFTCAHELGHHIFGHGTHVDELVSQMDEHAARSITEESLADVFAGFLLMPRQAVVRGFEDRGLDPLRCTPVEFYFVSEWLGVGYGTLATHMVFNLGIMPETRRLELLKIPPRIIHTSLINVDAKTRVVPVDASWVKRPVDVEVGDYILAPARTASEGRCVQKVPEGVRGVVLKAAASGIGKIFSEDHDWAAFVRVSRHHFVGRSIFRHLEDEEDDSGTRDDC